MQKECRNVIYLQVGVSLLGAMSVNECINRPETSLGYSYSIWAFILWLAWFLALRKAAENFDEKRKRRLIPCFVFSLLFTGSMVTGRQLELNGEVDFLNWHLYGAALVMAIAMAPIIEWVVWRLEISGEKAEKDIQVVPSHSLDIRRMRFFWTVWGILICCYMVTLLSVWPGFFTYDAEQEVYQVFTGKYSAHHPVMHVLLLGGIIRVVRRLTDSYNTGIAAYMILQIVVISGCFSYMLTFLKRCGVRRWVVMAGTLFMALFPTINMFACCSVKDVYFSAGIVLFTTLLLESFKNSEGFWKRRSKKLLALLSVLLILFFRNNGIYAFVIFLALFVFLCRKQWKKWRLVLMSALLIYGLATSAANRILDVKKGELAEMLSVPIQQLARTHMQAKDSFSEEELTLLYSLIPQSILELYNPELSDAVKVNFLEDNFKASPLEYISLWVRAGMRNFDIYVNSFLANTYGYWYPDTVLNGYRGARIVDKEYKDSSYFACVTETPGVRVHLVPVLEKFYEKVSLEIYQQKLPVISMLFSVGFWHWFYMFLALYLLLTGYRKQVVALSVMGLVYLTVLLGPIVLVRYVLFFFFGVPLGLALLFDAKAVAA